MDPERSPGRCGPTIFWSGAGRPDKIRARLGKTKPARSSMKARIIVTPKKAVVDPQGKTVQNALAHLGYTGVRAVHVGKYIEIELEPGTDRATVERALDDACQKFLSNPIIEDYRLEIVE